MLAPADIKFRGLDSLDACYGVHDLRLLIEGQEREDEECKYVESQHLRLLVGSPLDKSTYTFAYYVEPFGKIELER